MLISFAWLKELVPLTTDAAEVGRRLTARGLTVDAVTLVEGDTVFDLDVPANRPDALGHRGVAREVAAAFGIEMTPHSSAPEGAGAGAAVTSAVSVAIEAPDLCGRYTARLVRGVTVGPSPARVVRRLEACGLRSINNVVDASNLVMLELGQPVHFFDLQTLAGPTIRVRRATEGESLTTLDGIERSLDPTMLVIADATRPVALAGVIGGAGTEIRASTKNVLVEAAWFSPGSVRKTARASGLSTDASQRFERGCDPEAPPAAQDLAARWLAELAGGTPAPGMLDLRPSPQVARELSVRLARAARLLGYVPSADEASGALTALGLAPRARGDVLEVTVPTWRIDLEREVDLIEEIGRHLGYDRIPSRTPQGVPRPSRASHESGLEEAIRDRLAALGFNEGFSYAMIGPGEDDAFAPDGASLPLALANPIAETLGFLRRTLLPGLLRATDQNLRRGAADVRLFEVGGVFHARGPGELPDEPSHAGFAWAGAAEPAHWSGTARAADAWDAAGLIEDILFLAAGDRSFRRERADLAGLHPGQSLLWRDDSGRRVAWCGPVHPDHAARLGLSAQVLLGEADLALAARHPAVTAAYRTIPRFPGTWRDLSLVLEPDATSDRVLAALELVPAPAAVSMTWIDRYAGRPLAAGQVAMTLRVMLQPLDRTLTDAEAEAYRAELLVALDSVPGVRLRRIDT
jgi:phenylalanyl-tRNA synthetase beta chain